MLVVHEVDRWIGFVVVADKNCSFNSACASWSCSCEQKCCRYLHLSRGSSVYSVYVCCDDFCADVLHSFHAMTLELAWRVGSFCEMSMSM